MNRIVAALVLISLILGVLALPRPTSAQGARWTFMVYLDADNNLEDVGIDNFLSMAKVGSSGDVNIVVQFDRAATVDSRYGDWRTTKRYLIQKDMLPDSGSALYDMGEQNMANPTVLSDFVKWAVATYPADHYFLDLWDHGLGWQGLAFDDTSGDFLSTPELRQALSEITQFMGRPLDILANDACRMTLEIMYEAAPYVKFLVGSEKDEPAEGWPYDRVLGSLSSNPGMSPVELATTLVDEYVDYYRSGSSYSVTMALVNSTAMPQLVSSINSLVSAVNYTLPFSVESVRLARNESEHYEGNHCSMPESGDDYDLYDVASKLIARVDNGRVRTAAIALQTAIDRAVIHESHMDLPSAINCVRAINAHGLSIWYPRTMGSKQAAYEQLALSRDSLWDEHLKTYGNGTKPNVDLTANFTSLDTDSDGVTDTGELQFNSSADGEVNVDKYLNGDLASSNTHAVLSGISYTRELPLLIPGLYDVYLTFRQTTGTMNATAFHGILVSVNITIRGIIRDTQGKEVDGARVILRNMRTNLDVNLTTTSGVYATTLLYPVWMMNGDTIRITVTKDGYASSIEFIIQFQGQRLYWIDIILPMNDIGADGIPLFGDYWPLVVFPIAVLIAELVFLKIIIRKEKRMRTKWR